MITIKQIPNYAALPEALRLVIMDRLYEAMEALDAQVKAFIRDRDAQAFGTMIKSFHTIPMFGGDKGGPLVGVGFGSLLDYPAHVEFGTKPHFPPLRPIYSWVAKKLDPLAYGVKFDEGRGRMVPTGRITARRFGPKTRKNAMNRAAAIRSTAKRIQWAIAKRGTRGRFFMRDALQSLGYDFEVFADPGGMVYQIDAVSILQRDADFWAQVEGSIQG